MSRKFSTKASRLQAAGALWTSALSRIDPRSWTSIGSAILTPAWRLISAQLLSKFSSLDLLDFFSSLLTPRVPQNFYSFLYSYKNTSTEHCAAEDICSTPLDSLSARDAIVWGKLCGRTIDACVRDGDEPLELLVKDCTYRASVLCDAGHNAQLDDESIRCRGFALTPHVKPETTAITPYFFTWPMGEGRPSNGLLPPSAFTCSFDFFRSRSLRLGA